MHWLIACILLIFSGLVQPAEPEVSPPRRDSHEFMPSKHGFHFRNSFSGSPIPPAMRGLGIENLVNVPTKYGKCGGMSAAAADCFLAQTAIPADTRPPAEGTPLFGYITTRQIDSLGTFGTMTGKFMEMMAAPDTSPDAPSAASLTAPQIEPLLNRLAQGELVAIGLVYVASPAAAASTAPTKQHPSTPTSSPAASLAAKNSTDTPSAKRSRTGTLWENHQVLAFASPGQVERWASDQACAEIRIYDPNFPDNDQVVIFVRKIPQVATQPPQVFCEQRVGTSRTIQLRGFFPMPYVPRSPALAAATAPAKLPAPPAVR